MTPEEKGAELIDIFQKVLGVDLATAMVASEKCVEEIIEAVCKWSASTEPLHYWRQVQSYIESL